MPVYAAGLARRAGLGEDTFSTAKQRAHPHGLVATNERADPTCATERPAIHRHARPLDDLETTQRVRLRERAPLGYRTRR